MSLSNRIFSLNGLSRQNVSFKNWTHNKALKSSRLSLSLFNSSEKKKAQEESSSSQKRRRSRLSFSRFSKVVFFFFFFFFQRGKV